MRAIETSSVERISRLGRFRATTAALVGSVLLTVSSSALARPDFPGIIIDELNRTSGPGKPGITCTPTCSLCHTSPTPDSANAATKMANNLLAFRSAVKPPFDNPDNKYPGNITVDTLPVFLDALENDPCTTCMTMSCLPCDSDGDSKADIAELRVDEDPNNEGAKLACPKYGCGAHIAPEGPTRPIDGAAALAALSAAIVFVRRFRRR